MDATTTRDIDSPPDNATRNKRVKAAAWTAGLTAFFVLAGVDDTLTWPAAFVAGCVLLMVGYVCHQILYYR